MRNIESIQKHVNGILMELGEDPSKGRLENTSRRVANSLMHLTSGRQKDIKKIVNGALFKNDSENMILVKDISFFSLCEHHLLPFFGNAHIAYIPNGKVIGLSKIPRIVDMFSKRIQIQENLTQQIAEAISEIVKPKGIIVLLEARHFCVMMRGVEKNNISMVTNFKKGVFSNDGKLAQEFFNLIGNKKI